MIASQDYHEVDPRFRKECTFVPVYQAASGETISFDRVQQSVVVDDVGLPFLIETCVQTTLFDEVTHREELEVGNLFEQLSGMRRLSSARCATDDDVWRRASRH